MFEIIKIGFTKRKVRVDIRVVVSPRLRELRKVYYNEYGLPCGHDPIYPFIDRVGRKEAVELMRQAVEMEPLRIDHDGHFTS